MKLLITFSAILLLGITKLTAAPITADSLRQQLTITTDSLKGPIYTQIAAQYLRQYDSVSNSKQKLHLQDATIKNTLEALHYYSRYDDTTGLRISFNTLATVYQAEKKYSQAKWFILQSNSLSRAKNDVPNIISSLLVLASIKGQIKDYDLAMGDLNEALSLSVANHYPHTQSAVEQNFAMLYARMKNYKKEAIALRRHNEIEDSISRDEQRQLMAKINAADSLQLKKKPYLTSSKRIYNSDYFKRLALL